MKPAIGYFFIALFVFHLNSRAQTAGRGQPLPAWQEGWLDLHHINTGRGNAAFYIFPDGTTMLFDAGEQDPADPRTWSARNSTPHPNNSKKPYEWIAAYIRLFGPAGQNPVIDYAAISHFHDDHFGAFYPEAPLSASGKYRLTGMTGVGTLLPIHCMLDRGYPAYDYPAPILDFIRGNDSTDNLHVQTMRNYLEFIHEKTALGMHAEKSRAGSRRQIVLRHHAEKFQDFFVQNVKSNGEIWTGKDSSVLQYFPGSFANNPRSWPDENSLSLVFTIHYGPFVYYSGGDCAGNLSYGDPPWKDVETPVARAIGSVDVATMDHHGNRNALNEFQVRTLQPRIWIEQGWSSDHPGHEVLIRATSQYLYPGPRDLFATNLLEANKLVIGSLIDQSYKSTQGHILVRVLQGGKTYYVIILDDSMEKPLIKDVFGPYTSNNNAETGLK